MHQAIQSDIGKGRIPDALVPVFAAQLTGHNRRFSAMPVIQYLQ